LLLQLHEWGDRAAPPLVALHGVNAYGRRFRKLAEERLAPHFRVLAPDLRGHGASSWEPPWTIGTHVADVLETIEDAGVERAPFLGHSYGGRLILELAATAPEKLERAVLLDPAIQVLPHVAFDFAERERADRAYASPEEPIAERLAAGPTPREYAEEENREHLVQHPDGKFRFRYCQSAVVCMYAELATPPPPPETLRVPTLLLYAPDFGLVRGAQLGEYERALGDLLQIVEVPGGHNVYWDAYDETADSVAAFLEDARS
jgi:lipase